MNSALQDFDRSVSPAVHESELAGYPVDKSPTFGDSIAYAANQLWQAESSWTPL
jgi:hypothetical protein